jgi:hypothetical protein
MQLNVLYDVQLLPCARPDNFRLPSSSPECCPRGSPRLPRRPTEKGMKRLVLLKGSCFLKKVTTTVLSDTRTQRRSAVAVLSKHVPTKHATLHVVYMLLVRQKGVWLS